MKVLHISDSYEGGGAEAVLRDTITVSQELGYQNDTFVSREKTSIASYVYSFSCYNQLFQKLNDFKPDIIHLHNYYHYLSPSVLYALKKYKKYQRIKVIFTAHDYHIICPNSGFQYFKDGKRFNFDHNRKNLSLFKKFDHRSHAHSVLKIMQHFLCYRILKLNDVFDFIISPSNFMKSTLLNYGITKPIRVIRNPVCIINSERQFLLDDDSVHIVYVGRLTPEKGLVEFINKLNRETKEPIQLHLYGSGPSAEVIKSIKYRKDLKVIFHGFIDRNLLVTEISKYHMFVLPSIWLENAPVSIIEAAAAGLPVIVPNYGGLAEIAKETLYHYEFDYEDNDLSNIITQAAAMKGKNKLNDPNSFSYKTYKDSIRRLYTDELQ
ncbi:TPA: glycosyltransferase [Klebsiella michiganensis]|uniref:glycosyltransferase n=1 Tax=Klebsiella michiganensis TaxID=1134687 RepID=UPI0012B98821|nr:glycosyltransferase [Klebsiella michiganensis]